VLTKPSRIVSLESLNDGETVELIDCLAWDWYAESCSCGEPAGGCRVHPRGRLSQRPPVGDWRVWAYVAGRGAGKTRAGACWVQHRVEQGLMKVGCLIAPTANDIRDVMVEGQSGLFRPPPCPVAISYLLLIMQNAGLHTFAGYITTLSPDIPVFHALTTRERTIDGQFFC